MRGAVEPEHRWIDTNRTRREARRRAALRHPLLFLRGAVLRRHGLSERHATPVSKDDVLRRVAALPVSTWTYGWDHPSVVHLGPMAQDFGAAFGLGSHDDRIELVDAAGVLLAAVQALNARVEHLEAELVAVSARAGGDAHSVSTDTVTLTASADDDLQEATTNPRQGASAMSEHTRPESEDVEGHGRHGWSDATIKSEVTELPDTEEVSSEVDTDDTEGHGFRAGKGFKPGRG